MTAHWCKDSALRFPSSLMGSVLSSLSEAPGHRGLCIGKPGNTRVHNRNVSPDSNNIKDAHESDPTVPARTYVTHTAPYHKKGTGTTSDTDDSTGDRCQRVGGWEKRKYQLAGLALAAA